MFRLYIRNILFMFSIVSCTALQGSTNDKAFDQVDWKLTNEELSPDQLDQKNDSVSHASPMLLNNRRLNDCCQALDIFTCKDRELSIQFDELRYKNTDAALHIMTARLKNEEAVLQLYQDLDACLAIRITHVETYIQNVLTTQYESKQEMVKAITPILEDDKAWRESLRSQALELWARRKNPIRNSVLQMPEVQHLLEHQANPLSMVLAGLNALANNLEDVPDDQSPEVTPEPITIKRTHKSAHPKAKRTLSKKALTEPVQLNGTTQ